MSFVTAQVEALTAAAGKLQGIGSSMAAENAAAAAPTTGVVPAAADEVSMLQATQFAAYGDLYQQISAQATAVHEMFVNALRASAGSYGTAEAANSAAAGPSGIIGWLTQEGQFELIPGAISNSGLIALVQGGMFGSTASDLFQLDSVGFITGGTEALDAEGLDSAVLGGPLLAGAVGPAGPAGVGGAPVAGASVFPSWAGQATPAGTPATLAGASWTTAAPQHTPLTTVPAGVPSVATTGKSGGLGTPRYGVKPTVMGGSTAV